MARQESEIADEDQRVVLMSLSFLFVTPVFVGRGRLVQIGVNTTTEICRLYLWHELYKDFRRDSLETAVRWALLVGFSLAMVVLAGISIRYGLERLDRFEVAVISIDWLVLLVNGLLLNLVFRSALQGSAGAEADELR